MNLPTILYFVSIVLVCVLIGFLAWYWRQQVVRTDRAQVAGAQALLASETPYRRLFEAARDGILILDAESGVATDVNPYLVEMLGIPRAGIVGKELWELGFLKDIAANKANFLELQQQEYIRYEDLPLETADGRTFHVEFVSNVYQVDHHKVIQCNLREISGRKQVDTMLARLAAIVESSDDAIIGKTLEGLITSWNAGAERLYGYSAAEAIGKPVSILIPTDRPDELPEILSRLRRGERIEHFESVRLSKDGRRLDVSITISPIKDASGQISGASTIARDITERKRAEEVIKASETRYRSLFENMLNGFAYCRMIFEQDCPQDFVYLEVNRTCETLTGLKDVVGKKASEVIPGIQASDPELLERYGRVALTGVPETFENCVEALKMWFAISVYSPQKGYFVAVFDVISERKRAEQSLQVYNLRLEAEVAKRTRELQDAQEKMVRQERLATLGQLAGSVGHELRNPLGVISNAVYYLKMTQPDANPTIRDYLDIIEKETRTADKIVTDLLDFTRLKSVNREPVSVPDLLAQTLKRFPIPDSVEMTYDLPPDLPSVFADPGHIVQVLGNLVTNACQAIALPDGAPRPGKMTLSACQQGDMIFIGVQDSGAGIQPENMAKLFEPLFTTKTKGIGLGLAVSQRLIEANDGRIEVRSEPGQGSTFTIYLPAYQVQSNNQIVE
ncbi:MAG: PAS domain S-box protein [Anaerolineales bacterium]